jgi:hypothetical protein
MENCMKYYKELRGHSNDTLEGGQCHQASQGGGRGSAKVSRDFFSKNSWLQF